MMPGNAVFSGYVRAKGGRLTSFARCIDPTTGDPAHNRPGRLPTLSYESACGGAATLARSDHRPASARAASSFEDEQLLHGARPVFSGLGGVGETACNPLCDSGLRPPP